MLKSICGQYTCELTEKKSRFIAIAKNINSELEAKRFIEEQKRTFYDARHVTYAYRLTSDKKKYSDDGEPSGTAGIPILNVIEHKNFFYTIVVVIRYFGGILLGTGGLTRAYSLSAKNVLESEKLIPVEIKNYQQANIICEYDVWNQVRHGLENCFVEKVCYNEKVSIVFYTDNAEQIFHKLKLISSSKIILLKSVNVTGTFIDKKFICYGDSFV